MPTKYILRRTVPEGTMYFRDITPSGEPVTTLCAQKAIGFSMLGAVEIAKDLDRHAGLFKWKVIPQKPNEPCTCPST